MKMIENIVQRNEAISNLPVKLPFDMIENIINIAMRRSGANKLFVTLFAYTKIEVKFAKSGVGYVMLIASLLIHCRLEI